MGAGLYRRSVRAVLAAWLVTGCNESASSRAASAPAAAPLDSVEARFANVATPTAYVGDSSCAACHAAAAASYAQHSMARSFHPWTPDSRVEQAMADALRNAPTGFAYRVVDSAGALWQVETRPGDTARPAHELRRRIDYVMGSGRLARTYFTAENGRLFQLPLTWYADHGWDFSPGYEVNNARFSRLLPDRCLACHSSYPEAAPHLEGKYPVLRPGIGCERCHGPGAAHVQARREAPTGASVAGDSAFDPTIVNPRRLPLERRLDVCEQCHVHTSVAVLRPGRHAFDFTPARQLAAQYAYYKNGGDIDLVSHADRLRQSACFRATAGSKAPLECASCHNPHAPPPTRATRNQPCVACHSAGALASRFSAPASQRAHGAGSDCVSCHMPVVKERTVPHGTFSDHWIRVPGAAAATPATPVTAGPIDPYFERDRTGAEAPLYRAMGTVVFASLAANGKLFDDAASALQPLLAGNRTHPQAFFLLGVAHESRGRAADAVAAFERARALGDERPELLRALARARLQLGDEDEARDLYVQALAQQPALAWIRAEYADALHREGDLAGAEREYRAALAEQPSLAAASFNLGLVLLARQQTAPAAEALLNAVRLEPAYGTALAALLAVEGSDTKVRRIATLPSPVATVQTAAAPTAFGVQASTPNRVHFTNTPPAGYVLVFTPDGALQLAVPTNGGGTVTWDLRTGAGRVLAPGLYRAELQWRGGPSPGPSVWFAMLRVR